ncbi:hypothetical protein JXO52_17735 [bacterium]|nr:hypothetical protein [bacterium]
MLKLIFYFVVGYLGYKLFRLFKPDMAPKEQVRGQNRNKPLDLSRSEVEDAHFEDIPEDK